MSNDVLLIQKLSEIINNDQSSANGNGRSIRFSFSTDEKILIESIIQSLELTFEFHLNNQCEIRIDKAYRDGKLILFLDEADFLKRSIQYLPNFEHSHFAIIKGEFADLQKLPQELYSKEKCLFFNFCYYHNIFQFLESQEHFISVNSRPDRQFIIFSSDKGPFHIGYDLHEQRVKNLEDLKTVYQSLATNFQKIDFVQFFKSAVITTIYEYSIPERFFYLVQGLRIILNVAERDHYIYIRNFDFEKIKSKFQEERKDYFESLEKNIDSISKQVTSFPLTFAATIFTGYQVKNNPSILILVFMAYSLYTLIAWKILDVTKLNIRNIETDVQAEENKIKKDYELLFADFQPDFLRIVDKINKVSGLVFILKIVLVGLLSCFFIFWIYESFFV